MDRNSSLVLLEVLAWTEIQVQSYFVNIKGSVVPLFHEKAGYSLENIDFT